jgi:phospholipid/cholesterol/gamma-HCH transport system substrate-binding protein
MSLLARRRKGRHKRRLHPLVIAALVIFVTAFITFYAFNEGLPFTHEYTLYALVNNSVNVRQDSPVRIAGIDVGSVEGASPAGRATKIAFTVQNSGLPIHTDATIRVRDRLFLEGGYYLELDPGSPSAPKFHDGDTIPEAQTATPVQFYNVLSTFDAATRRSLENSLQTFNKGFNAQPGHPVSDSGAAGLKGAIPQLTPTLKDTAIVTRALRGTHPGDVETLLSSASQVTGTLANNSRQLADLVTGLNRTTTALVASDGALAQSISGFDQTLRAAPPALSAIDHALPPVVKLAAALDPSLKLAPPLLDDVTGAVRELAKVVAPAERQRLLTTLKATFQQFPSILSELGSTFPITKQITDCLRTHVTPLLNEVVPDGSLTTGRPAWQDFVHFLPNVAGASGNYDANGPYTRVLAAAGTNTLSGTGSLLGSLPIIGKLVGSAPPGGSSVQGVSPVWIGDLRPSAFRPDQPCTKQKLPSLGAAKVTADLKATQSPASKPMTLPQLRRATAARARADQKAAGG